MATRINSNGRTVSNILYRILDSKTFLVRVPTAALISNEELKLKGIDKSYNTEDTRNLDATSELNIFKEKQSKKKQPRRDTMLDDIVLDSNGSQIGSMPSTTLNNFVNRRRKKKISKRDKILQDTSETYLPISKLIEIAKDGFSIRLLNNNDVKVIYDLSNEVLDKIENSLNFSNNGLKEDLNDFLEELTDLNTHKLTNEFKKKDNTIMEDMFGTDIFMTSPAPKTMKYDIKSIKV